MRALSQAPVLLVILALACVPDLPGESDGCEQGGCPPGTACLDGRCVVASCPEAPCPSGQRCVEGRCFATSCEAPCAGGEVCVGGVCVEEACASKECAEDALCLGGTCYPLACEAEPCGEAQVCAEGECMEIACVGTSCGAGEACRAGVCVVCESREVSCGDGRDDDCDRKVDCADPDCDGAVCGGGLCLGGRCLGPCEDGEQNGAETDMDCGGGACPPCGLGRTCGTHSDCESGGCEANHCVTVSCHDGLRNGAETDVDCGGGCRACAPGRRCGSETDCTSGVCREERCGWPSCGDGVRNGTESDVDCGGLSCPLCAAPMACAESADCFSGLCVGGACVARSCSDGLRNGAETDVDCGGESNCGPCADGRACGANSDCLSDRCLERICAADSCLNGVKDPDEADVDCGGPFCPGCDENKACGVGSDCLSGSCALPDPTQQGTCALARCDDGVRNGGESDVDCGESCAVPCAAGKACGTQVDCESGVCRSLRCAAPLCTDGVFNGAETGGDCGGGCPGCALGQHCAGVTDCASLACEAGVCVASASCRAVQQAGLSSPDGRYWIDPDGADGLEPAETYCLMGFAGGGWTLAQRTVWEPTETAPLRTGYSDFLDRTIGSAQQGRGFRLPGRWWPALAANREHLVIHRVRTADGGRCEPLYYLASGEWVMEQSGGASIREVVQTVPLHNLDPQVEGQGILSATGEGPGLGCLAEPQLGVPWTYNSCCATCPTFAGSYFSEPHPMASYLTTPDAAGRSLGEVCGGRVPAPTLIETEYVGIDSMEYFVR